MPKPKPKPKAKAKPRSTRPEPVARPVLDDTVPRYRSGAVARMARMPVATLRTWERRFQVIAPTTTPSGHRFYSAADVHRLTLLKQLSDIGHSISAMAGLDMDSLREMAITHANTRSGAQRGLGSAAAPMPPPWRVAVVGPTLARQLQRASVLSRLGRRLEVVCAYDTLADLLAAAALPAPVAHSSARARRSASLRRAVDLLLVSLPNLHIDTSVALRQAAEAWGVDQIALMYRYGSSSACETAIAAGIAAQQGPLDDTALAGWLRGLGDATGGGQARAAEDLTSPHLDLSGTAMPAPRRYDDVTLSDIARLSSTIACECPRHVAELLMQLSHFEAYSAECSSRSRADAHLHRYLQRATATARAIFEVALERVAVHEGLLLTG